MQTTDIERDIRAFLVENFLFGRAEGLRDEEPLLGSVIDSSGVLEFVNFLEERFAIAISDEEVTNLASVKNTVGFLEKKLRARS